MMQSCVCVCARARMWVCVCVRVHVVVVVDHDDVVHNHDDGTAFTHKFVWLLFP